MKHKTPTRRKRKGAYFVELAFTLIPMLAVLLAIVDYSMPIFFRSLLTHAAREGVRYGVTYQTTGSGNSQTTSIQDVVMAQSAGFLTGSTGRSKIQVNYCNLVTCAPGATVGNANGNIVQVNIVGFQWTYMAPLGRTDAPTITINASSAGRLQALPATMVRPTP